MVVHEESPDRIEEATVDVGDRLDPGMDLGGVRDGEEPIVALPRSSLVSLLRLEIADQAGLDDAAGVDGGIEQDDGVERITVVGQRLRDESEVERE